MFGSPFGPPPSELRGSLRMFLFLWTVVIVVLAIGLVHASAHSWYPYSCCSEQDCYPISIPHSEIERTETGWRLKKERITIPFDAARQSPDNQFHICRNELGKGQLITPSGQPPCFWAPGVEG